MNNLFKKISIIVPVFNEEKNIEPLIRRIDGALKKVGITYEIIFVNDYSGDKTASVVRSFITSFPVKLIQKRGEKGKAYSIYEGIQYARYDTIAMIDADLQYPPEAIPQMMEMLTDSDIIVTNRKSYNDSFLRKLFSKSFRFIFGKKLFGLNHDIQSGLKIFKKEVVETIKFTPASPWTFDLEFLHRAKQAGYVISDFDIVFSKRSNGKSKVSFLGTTVEIGVNALKLKTKRIHPAHIAPNEGHHMLGAGVGYKKNKYITHTTIPHHLSALKTFTKLQKFIVLAIISLLAFGIITNFTLTLQIAVAILSAIYFADVLFNFFLIVKSLNSPSEITYSDEEIEKLNDNELPIYSILCPLYKEAQIIPQFLDAISKISWPKNKLDVILLLEEDDKATIDATSKMDLPSYVRVVVVPHSIPKTKPKACNYGLAFARGEMLVIYDAEDVPDPLQLKKAYLGFKKSDKNVICLQAKLNYYNPHQNLLTRFFTAEYSLWFDITLPGLQTLDTALPLGGTSNHFKTENLREVQGWDPFNVTEDADLGIRLFKKGYKTAMIDSVTLEEANSNVKNWFRQRSRWIKGYMQTYLVHTRGTKPNLRRSNHSLIFQLVIGGKIAFVLINPILWVMTASYFLLYEFVGPQIETLYPSVVFYMAITSLVLGNFLFLYYYMIGIAKRNQWNLIKFVFLVPIYWLMISISAFIALYQLIFKPHYWEKTIHGLHLENSKDDSSQDLDDDIEIDEEEEEISAPATGNSRFGYALTKTRFSLTSFFTLSFLRRKQEQIVEESEIDEKLNILIFNWRDTKHKWAGGAEVYVHELAKRWVKEGNEVTLFAGNDGKNSKNDNIDGVNIIRRGGFYSVYVWAFLYFIFKFRGKYDVIIDSENGIPFFTPLYSREEKFLIIHHVHQEVFRKSLRWPLSTIALFLEAKLMPFLYRKIQVITVSPSSRDEILKHKLTKLNPIIIYNGVDPEIFKPAAKSETPLVIYLGRLQYYKSLHVFLVAAKRILKKVPDAQFIIAGEGEEKSKLIDFARKIGISENVQFLGHVSENKKIDLFQRAWVFVNPSFMEGWGITTIEANACATPVVASNVLGLRDSIKDSKTGFLPGYGKYEEFTKSILLLINDKKLRKEMSREAVLWASEFNWDMSARKFLNEIQRSLNKGSQLKNRGFTYAINRITSLF